MDIPPAVNSPKNILNVLDDDCIGEILRRLPRFEDFLNVAETCRRFEKCALDSQHRFQSISIGVRIAICNYENLDQLVNVPAYRAITIFRKYGNILKSIYWESNVKYPNLNDEIFKSMVKFCGKTLKRLTVWNYNSKFSKYNSFQLLEYLELRTNWNFVPSINMTCEDKPWFVRRFPNLQTAILSDDDQITDVIFTEFLSLNPQLEVLKIDRCSALSPSGILQSIGTHAKNLQVLSYTSVYESAEIYDNLLHLRELKHLRKLHIRGEYSVEILMNMIIEYNIPISALGIYANFTEAAQNIPIVKTLKHITIGSYYYNKLSDDHLINLMKSQTALESIFIYDNNVTTQVIAEILKLGKNLTEILFHSMDIGIDMETYSEILSLANNRVKVRMLLEGKIEVPKNILDENKKWLYISCDWATSRKTFFPNYFL